MKQNISNYIHYKKLSQEMNNSFNFDSQVEVGRLPKITSHALTIYQMKSSTDVSEICLMILVGLIKSFSKKIREIIFFISNMEILMNY